MADNPATPREVAADESGGLAVVEGGVGVVVEGGVGVVVEDGGVAPVLSPVTLMASF